MMIWRDGLENEYLFANIFKYIQIDNVKHFNEIVIFSLQ